MGDDDQEEVQSRLRAVMQTSINLREALCDIDWWRCTTLTMIMMMLIMTM